MTSMSYFSLSLRGGKVETQAGAEAAGLVEKKAIYRTTFHGLPSPLSYVIQGRLPGGSTAHTGLSPPHPRINYSSRKCPQLCSQMNLIKEVL